MRYFFQKLKTRGQAGDTIVEVMIVLAVLGLSLSISYATANHALIQSRNAEEHSEALGILNSQVELLRQAFAQQVTVKQDGTAFCMQGTTPVTGFGTGYPTATAAADDFTQYPNHSTTNDCNHNSFYYASIVYDTTNSDFDLRVRWDGLGSLGRQQEELTYLISASSMTGSFTNGYSTAPVPTMSITSPNSDTTTSSGHKVNFTAQVNASAGATYSNCVMHVKDTVNSANSKQVNETFSGSTCSDSVTMGSDTLQVYFTATVSVTSASVNVTSDTRTIDLPAPGPVLAASGCTGPVGTHWASYPNCQGSDTIAVTVSGVNSGDKCVFKNDNGDNSGSTVDTVTASGTSCTDNLSISSITSSQTGHLTAYVTDQGNSYTSNSLTFNSWPNTTIYLSCGWDGPHDTDGADNYSNWTYTVDGDSCPSDTVQCTAGVNCGNDGKPMMNYGADIACKDGSIYTYSGGPWDGVDYDRISCPPGATQVSRANLRSPPGSLVPDLSKIAMAYQGCLLTEQYLCR